MGKPKSRRPDSGLDFAQNARRVVDEATGEAPRSTPPERKPKNRAAVALSRLGAKKGGEARAAKLSARKKREIARKAAAARWSRRK